jgi:hypothetical protein
MKKIKIANLKPGMVVVGGVFQDGPIEIESVEQTQPGNYVMTAKGGMGTKSAPGDVEVFIR